MATITGKRRSLAMDILEQRKHRRYHLELPVHVRLTARKANQQKHLETSSRDISAHGVFLILPEKLTPGTEMEFDIQLPKEIAGAPNVRVRCRARIARLERAQADGQFGVGARIERYEFIHDATPVSSSPALPPSPLS